jgi:hypothetical protein
LLILFAIVARPGLAQQVGMPISGQIPAPDVMSESSTRTSDLGMRALPQVTYSGGQLSVNALHCTLQEVLRSIANATGAQLEIPPGVAGEAVAIHQGPGAATDVLARILNGSSFDYMIVGNGGDGTLQRVVLISRNGPRDVQENVASSGSAGQEPELYGGQGFSVTPGSEENAAAAVAQEQENERNADPEAKAQGQVLDALQKEMLRQRHVMQEQQQQQHPTPQ